MKAVNSLAISATVSLAAGLVPLGGCLEEESQSSDDSLGSLEQLASVGTPGSGSTLIPLTELSEAEYQTLWTRLNLARAHAPLIVHAPDETYFPSSVEFFAARASVLCPPDSQLHSAEPVYRDASTSGTPLFGQPTTTPSTNLVTSSWGANCYLVASQANPQYAPPVARGQNLSTDKVPIYVSIKTESPTEFTVYYNAFYPYNLGKMACGSLAPFGECLVPRVRIGNHIGDWESVAIRFNNNGNIVSVGTKAHNLGWQYLLPNAITFGSGDASGHPIVYSASGSHGMWPTPGDHTYKTLITGDTLVDWTGPGQGWRTWEHLELVAGSTIWMDYKGRWGDPQAGMSTCDLSGWEFAGSTGACGGLGIPYDEWERNPGPTGLDSAHDYARRYVDTARSPSRFDKPGNHGTVSCSAYCANDGHDWGDPGTCVSAYDTLTNRPISCGAVATAQTCTWAGPHWWNLRCTTPPPPHEVECTCESPSFPSGTFNKIGNNGTTTCNRFCANTPYNWGRYGVCVGGINNSTNRFIGCDEIAATPTSLADVECFCR